MRKGGVIQRDGPNMSGEAHNWKIFKDLLDIKTLL
jgi:hypothetical protein